MDAKHVLTESMKATKDWADQILKDISEADSIARGQDQMNPIKWLVGHLCVSSRFIVTGLGKEMQLPAGDTYSKMFEWGSVVADDPAVYPPLADVKERFNRAFEAVMKVMGETSEADLDKEREFAPGWKATTGQFLMFMGLHQAYHVGQMAAVRTKVLKRKGLQG